MFCRSPQRVGETTRRYLSRATKVETTDNFGRNPGLDMAELAVCEPSNIRTVFWPLIAEKSSDTRRLQMRGFTIIKRQYQTCFFNKIVVNPGLFRKNFRQFVMQFNRFRAEPFHWRTAGRWLEPSVQ